MRRGMRNLAYVLVAALLIVLVGCDYQTERGYVNRRNVDEYIQRLELGGAIDNKAVIWPEELADLEEYVTAVRDDYYADSERERYRFHIALIGLRQAEFYESFRALHDLAADPEYTAGAYFHIAEAIRHQYNVMYSGIVYGVSVLATRESFPEPLTIGQHIRAMANNSMYPYFQMVPYLTAELIERPGLEDFARRLRLVVNRGPSEIDEEAILSRNLVSNVDEEFVLTLVQQTGGAQYAYDYAVAYYSQPYVRDYQTAVRFAEMVDYRDWVRWLPHTRVAMLTRAYIGVGGYEKALEIYDYHADKFDRDVESVNHVHLVRAAAYAGLNRDVEAFAALQREFEITEIRANYGSLDRAGDMLVSLYEYFFVFDEFERYRDTEWEDRMVRVIDQNMDRYRDLPIFRRQLDE